MGLSENTTAIQPGHSVHLVNNSCSELWEVHMMAFVTNVLILEPMHSLLCSISKRRQNRY